MQSPEFTLQIALVLGVVGVTIILFITEWLRVDLVAILVMVALPLMGLVEGRETFLGLSSTAVISIIAVIIMGRGLDHTGVINRGVSPLIMLNDLLRPFGIEPFSLFSVTPVGIAIVLTGVLYFIVLGRSVLPERTESSDQQQQEEVSPLIYYPELVKLFELENRDRFTTANSVHASWSPVMSS
jgi:hypothetical protein